MPIKPASAKAKGRALQKLVRDKILDAYPALTDEDVRSTAMGQNGEDIQLSPAARALFPFTVECRSRAAIAYHRWFDDASKRKQPGVVPIVVSKENRKDPLVAMPLDVFFDLLRRIR